MAHIVESTYEMLKKANLQAGPPKELILIEGGDKEAICSISDIKARKDLPPNITLAGFSFERDDSTTLFVFPETEKYDDDGFLAEDVEKIRSAMKTVFSEAQIPAQTIQKQEIKPTEVKIKKPKGKTCGTCSSYGVSKCFNRAYRKEYPSGMDVDPEEKACGFYSVKKT